MKICFVIPRIYAYFDSQHAKFAGGAERQAYYLVKGLSEKSEFEISCIVADFGQKDDVILQGIRVLKSFELSEGRFSGFSKLIKAVKKADADLYIYRSADVGTAASIFFQKVFLRKKILYMVASDSELDFNSLKRMSGFATALAMPFAYETARYITVQSKHQYRLFEKNRGRQANALIPNISEIEITTQNKESKSGTLWIGRLDPVKQPEVLLDLAKKYPNEHFTMVAPVVKEHQKFGQQIVLSIKSISNIKYLPYISPDKIGLIYKQAQIYTITSYTEGFSNTMAEAIAGGCPVLSYNVNPDNIITTYNFGFCANNEIKNFYESFETLINNKKQCLEMAKNGQVYLQKNHNKNLVIEQFSKLLLSQ